MEDEERSQTERVLAGISRDDWNEFLASEEGEHLRSRIDGVRETLRGSGHLPAGAPARPIADVVVLLGHRLLSNEGAGQWLREKTLQNLTPPRWQRLARVYKDMASRRATPLHHAMSQQGKGSEVMASYWHQGSAWARTFCEIAGLPELLARSRPNPLPDDEDVHPVEALAPLHDFQIEVYTAMRELLQDGLGKAAMLSLPTGAGKTRVTVEAICDHLAEDADARKSRNVVLWIAQSTELQQQAWECFREVWQVPPQREDGSIRRTTPLRIVRLWGGRDPDEVTIGDEMTILVAGIDQLASWVHRRRDFFDNLPKRRLACVVVDEAHSLITKEHREVFLALNLRAKHEWQTLKGAPPVIGLSATPWRSSGDETAALGRYFHERLLRPGSLRERPIHALQKRGILARVDDERLDIEGTRAMTASQRRNFERYKVLPSDYVEQIGLENQRNARILARLLRLPKRARTLVFACSIAHAEILTMALNRAVGEECAALVTGKTPRAERADVIQRFRKGDGLRFLCNVGVLTTGFDAPRADTVCITRPTMSPLLYEQMVGRGLRGPKNGGTERCLVIDVQDEGMPEGIQSYERVLHLWDK